MLIQGNKWFRGGWRIKELYFWGGSVSGECWGLNDDISSEEVF